MFENSVGYAPVGHIPIGLLSNPNEASVWNPTTSLVYGRVWIYVDPDYYSWGTTAVYYGGLWYEPRLMEVPEINIELSDDYGIIRKGRTSIKIEDTDNVLANKEELFIGEYANITIRYQMRTGTNNRQLDYLSKLVITGYSRSPGVLTLEAEETEDETLQQDYPKYKYTADDWPDLYQGDEGRVVPVVIGQGIKTKGAYIYNNGTSIFRYALCEYDPSYTYTVSAIYRDGRLVSSSEYTTGNYTGAESGVKVFAINFSTDQVDPNGNFYTIEADVSTTHSTSGVDEIARLFDEFSINYNSTNFAAAKDLTEQSGYVFDTVHPTYGRDTTQTLESILKEILTLCRANLYKNYGGYYCLMVDVRKTPVMMFSDYSYISASDSRHRVLNHQLCKITGVQKRLPHKNVKVSYKESSQDPSTLSHTLELSTTKGIGTETFDFRLVREHWPSRQFVEYRRNSIEYSKKINAEFQFCGITVGTVIQLFSKFYRGIGEKGTRWRVTGISYGQKNIKCELREYSDSIHNITGEAPVPTGASSGYEPDYSQTPPAAPTAFTNVGSGAAITDDNEVISCYQKVKCTPPSVNWNRIYFACEETVSKGLKILQGTEESGDYVATFDGLSVGKSYKYWAWARNKWDVDGYSTSGDTYGACGTSIAAPNPPTSVTPVSSTLRKATDGTIFADLRTRCTAPTGGTSWALIKFKVTDNSTSEEFQLQSKFVTPYYEARFANLSPEHAYNIEAWTESKWGLESTHATYASNPYSVASGDNPPAPDNTPTVIQGTGKSVRVNMTGATNTPKDVAEYQIVRAAGSSGGSYASVGTSKGTIFIDVSVVYGTTYYYKFRWLSNWGGIGGLSTNSSGITPVRLVTDDVGDSQITTGKVAASAISQFQTSGLYSGYSILTKNGWTNSLRSVTITATGGTLQFLITGYIYFLMLGSATSGSYVTFRLRRGPSTTVATWTNHCFHSDIALSSSREQQDAIHLEWAESYTGSITYYLDAYLTCDGTYSSGSIGNYRLSVWEWKR